MRTLILTSLVGVVLVTAWGCGDSVTDCISSRTCSYSDEGGTTTDGGGADADSGVVVPPGCDLTKDPKDAPACIDNGVGIFVAPTGNDSSSGSKELPVKTIGKGVQLAASRGLPRVYVCEGTYDSAVEIKSAVGIHGGLSCAWQFTGAKPKIAPPTGPAVRVTKVSGAVVIADVEAFGSADANVPGDSAIGAFVSESTDVTFRGTTLSTGNAVAGAKGTARSNYSTAAPAGNPANGAAAGSGPPCTCADGTSSKGGNGAAGNGADVSAGSSMPAVGSANSGFSNLTTCGDGTVGAGGAANAAGAGPTVSGKLSAAGWSSASTVVNAPNGNPAQGGGGGGAKTQSGTNAGGGGGCGGCGGAGGTSGQNGGSSFALVSFNSGVVINGGALIAGAAGNGGDGGEGQAGQAGGALGTGACNGGPGGSGAGGSGGGGGAGGHSVAVAFVGTEPRVTGATLTSGVKGSGGAGGLPGAGPGNAGATGTGGPEGKAQNSLAL